MDIAQSLQRTLAIVLVSVCIFSTLACSDDKSDVGPDDVSTAAAKANVDKSKLCDTLDDLKTSVDKLGSLKSSSTADEAKQAGKEVSDSLESVKDAADDAGASRIGLIKTAFDALASTVNNLPGNQTIGAAVTTLTSQVVAIGNAGSSLKTKAGCS